MNEVCESCGQRIRYKGLTKEEMRLLRKLRYMVLEKHWLFSGMLRNDAYKKDGDLMSWLRGGLIEMDAEHGFRATIKAEGYLNECGLL